MRWALSAGGYLWLYVAVVPFHMNEAAFRIILPPYLQEIDFGLELIGVLVALYGVAALASRLPIGLLYRRERARPLAAVVLVLSAALSLGYAHLSDPLALILLRLGHGFCMGTAGTLHLALFLEARPPAIDRGRATSLYAATTTTAYLMGNFAAGALADTFGYATAFAVAGGCTLLAAGVTLLIQLPTDAPALVRSPRRGPAPGSPAAAPVQVAAERRLHPAQRIEGIRQLLRNRGVRHTCLASLVANLIVEMTWNFVPLWGVAAGYSLATVGAVRSAGNIGGFFSRILASEVGRRTGWGVLSAGSIVTLGVIIVALPSSTALPYLAAIVTALATIRGLQNVSNNVMLMEETDADPRLRGMGSAVVSMSRDVGTILGPVIGGFVAAGVGLEHMFRLVPLPFLALYVPLLVIELRRRRRELRTG